MKSYAIDFYGGPVPHEGVTSESVPRALPARMRGKNILAIEGAISGFRALHVDTWLTFTALDSPPPKQGEGIFGLMKTGDAAQCSMYLSGLKIPIPSAGVYVNYWAHNMNEAPFDWHGGYVFYYE
jgi:hypothetical protein